MRGSSSERGATLITVALMLTVLIAFLALVVDVGVGYAERRRNQSVADAAALAGIQVLVNNFDNDAILAAVHEYALVQNPPNTAAGETRVDPTINSVRWIGGASNGLPVTAGGRPPAGVTGIQVTVRGTAPTFFANVLGITTVSAVASGSGGYSPLDVMLVIDESISMAFYSCNFERFYDAGQPCRSFATTLTPESKRIQDVYYSCHPPNYSSSQNCGGIWATATPRSGTRTPTPRAGTPTATINAQCYWARKSGGGVAVGTPMATPPAECATPGVTNRTNCQACQARIVTPLHPMTELKAAASHFVDLVEVDLAPTYPRMGLATFSDWGHEEQELTYNLDDVRVEIGRTNPEGNTNIEDGLYVARSEINSRGRATAVKAIIFMTDGVASAKRNSCYRSFTQCALDEAVRAQNNSIRIYTIGLGDGVDTAMLQQMATDTNLANGDFSGAYVHARDATELDAAYATIFAMIKQLRLVE